MARAMLCDRCGKFYISNNEHKTAGRIHGDFITGIAVVNSDRMIDMTIDMCDDCLTEFFEFVENEDGRTD